MKLTIYTCDYCNKVLSNETDEIAVNHINIHFNNCSYAIYKRGQDPKWVDTNTIRGHYQFCNLDCLCAFLKIRDIKGIYEQQKKGK